VGAEVVRYVSTAGGDEDLAAGAADAEGEGVGGAPDVVYHQQDGLFVKGGAQVSGGGVGGGGVDVIVAESLDPGTEQGEKVRLLAEGGPEDAIGEALLDLLIVSQSGG
jgi:hypothetical protein